MLSSVASAFLQILVLRSSQITYTVKQYTEGMAEWYVFLAVDQFMGFPGSSGLLHSPACSACLGESLERLAGMSVAVIESCSESAAVALSSFSVPSFTFNEDAAAIFISSFSVGSFTANEDGAIFGSETRDGIDGGIEVVAFKHTRFYFDCLESWLLYCCCRF